MKKRFLSAILAFIMVLSLMPVTVLAVTVDIWDGSVATSFGGGKGTEEDPYQIRTAAQLAYLAQSVNEGTDYEDNFFMQTNDINLNNIEWLIIGNGKFFCGNYDGANHSITGLSITSNSSNEAKYVGLFGQVGYGNVSLQNIKLLGNIDVANVDAAGMLIGYHDSYSFSDNSLKIDNCSVSGKITSVGSGTYGGIIGSSYTGSANIQNCESSVNLVITSFNGGTNQGIGGIIGYCKAYNDDSAVIFSCSNSGDISVSSGGAASSAVGGIAGGVDANALLEYCSNSGNILENSNYHSTVGGVVGELSGITCTATINKCFNMGEVRSEARYVASAGGIVGENRSNDSVITNCYNSGTISDPSADSSDGTGGIVGWAYYAVSGISTSYNAGRIAADGYSGALIGRSISREDVLSQCYYLESTAPAVGNNEGVMGSGAVALSDSDMKYQGSFIGFDFDTIWEMGSDVYLYPILRMPGDGTPPGSGNDSSDKETAVILSYSPVPGATNVGYDAADPPSFRITFDRNIASGEQEYLADVDLESPGAFKIYRASDDKLVYPDAESKHWYSQYDFGLVYNQKNILSISPVNRHTLLQPGTEYYITMGEGFIAFGDGSTNRAINKGEWTFKTTGASFFSTTGNVTIQTGDEDFPTAPVQVFWDDGWFVKDATAAYNHDLARAAMALSGAAYVEDSDKNPSSASIRAALQTFGFEEIETHNYSYPLSESDNDHVAVTFAVKRIRYITDETTFLVAVVIKGTSGNEEWYSNFNIQTGSTHAGFELAKTELMGYLKEYLGGLGLGGQYKDNTKILVTGHSRGAAVANLVAAELSYSNYATQSNVYGYTFATPTVSTRARETGYENIFNIISGEDFVTQIPLGKWNYSHYGIDLLLPSKSYYPSKEYSAVSAKMASTYKRLVKKDFDFYPNGTQNVDSVIASVYQLAPSIRAFYTEKHDISGTLLLKTTTTNEYFQILADVLVNGLGVGNGLQILLSSNQSDFAGITWFFIDDYKISNHIFSAHSMAGYYSWLESCTATELFRNLNERTRETFKRIKIACPVDVYVYDESGMLVASVINETIGENTLATAVEAGVKTIDLPSDQNYTIEIIATDEGSVNYTVEEWSAQATGDSVLRTVMFNPIDIESGDELTGEVNDVLYTDSDNYALAKNDEDTIYPDSDSLNTRPSTPSHPSVSSNPNYQITVPTTPNGTVAITPKSAKSGDKVTIVVTPNAGYDTGSVTVTDKDGKQITISDAGDNKYTFIMPRSKVDVKVEFVHIQNNLSFTDVQPDAYYYDAVAWAVEKSITAGTSATTFSPDAFCTRAQIVTFLWRSAGSPKASVDSPFTDVPVDSYYYDAVLWAVEQGITNGISVTTFSPDATCTRAHAVTFLYRYEKSPAVSGTNNFTDVDTDAYYADAVQWAVGKNVTAGTSATTFSPNATCTRTQIVTFLYRDMA